MATPSSILFEHVGIGSAINRYRLRIPLNQREYAWEDKHVTDLLQDFSGAITSGKKSYFLGTIVLAGGQDGGLEVVDGQQRLATTTILLAAIRDWLSGKRGKENLIKYIEQEFLYTIDPDSESRVPRLRLNATDHDYFVGLVLPSPNATDREGVTPSKASHEKLRQAAKLAKEHVEATVSVLNAKDRIDHLKTWLNFIKEIAQVILLRVPDDLNAFVMFETLNDRGLRVSQADLLKNYLFQESDDHLAEAQMKWSGMNGILEGSGVDDVVMTYLRHFVISQFGHTRGSEVFEKIKRVVSGKGPALAFLENLSTSAIDYVAIMTDSHTKWNASYSVTIRQSIKTLEKLRVVPLRPLMLSIVRKFAHKEVDKAFRLFIAWAVRFLIVGGGRSGRVEEGYADLAERVYKGEISTVADLARAASPLIPTDAEFRSEFEKAKVANNGLARYYLRSLELRKTNSPEPEFIPNEDPIAINLEHVLPENPDFSEWPEFEPETASIYLRRLGNMVLLQTSRNNALGNQPFSAKRDVLRSSGFLLTQEVGRQGSWNSAKITDRQKKLAELAVQVWTITV